MPGFILWSRLCCFKFSTFKKAFSATITVKPLGRGVLSLAHEIDFP